MFGRKRLSVLVLCRVQRAGALAMTTYSQAYPSLCQVSGDSMGAEPPDYRYHSRQLEARQSGDRGGGHGVRSQPCLSWKVLMPVLAR